jgi:hypothetical protein
MEALGETPFGTNDPHRVHNSIHEHALKRPLTIQIALCLRDNFLESNLHRRVKCQRSRHNLNNNLCSFLFIQCADIFRTFLRRRQSLQEASNLHRKDYGAI